MKKFIQPPNEPLVSGTEIGRQLDLNSATIRRYGREGMPHHILGEGLIRYRLTEVLEWLAQRPRKTKKEVAAK